MKKNLMMGVALIAALALVSCKTKESSYKKAYEKAKAQEVVQTEPVTTPTTPVVAVTPVQTVPVTDNTGLRQERLDVMNGGNLKSFNVVCGSFSKVENANNLRNTLVAKGYAAQVAKNPDTGMYRVIAESFDDRNSAVRSRDVLRSTYPDAWLLYRTY